MDTNCIIAVIVQHLICAETSGVLFTANPVTGQRDQVMISAAWGLGETIVSGKVTPDTLIVDKGTGRVLSRQTADKQVMTVSSEVQTEEQPVPEELRRRPVLSAGEASELARLGEAHGLPVIVRERPLMPRRGGRGHGAGDGQEQQLRPLVEQRDLRPLGGHQFGHGRFEVVGLTVIAEPCGLVSQVPGVLEVDVHVRQVVLQDLADIAEGYLGAVGAAPIESGLDLGRPEIGELELGDLPVRLHGAEPDLHPGRGRVPVGEAPDSRRVLGVEAQGRLQVITAHVPMTEVLLYAPDLISKTGGRGTYTMEFDHYEEVPPQQAEKIIAEAKAAREKE